MIRHPQIILALDVDSFQKAKKFVDKFYPKIKIFKVGPRLFITCGLKIIQYIHRKGGEIFLDLKFHDIPNTVANAVRAAARLKVKILTLHISGGEEMLKSAVKVAINGPVLAGVTVLTSQKVSPAQVLKLAKRGLACGLDAVVCSAQEAAYLRKAIQKKFYIITPGIRLASQAKADQKRVATAAQAIKAGSDFLVVGRPILEAKDPLKALEEMKNEN